MSWCATNAKRTAGACRLTPVALLRAHTGSSSKRSLVFKGFAKAWHRVLSYTYAHTPLKKYTGSQAATTIAGIVVCPRNVQCCCHPIIFYGTLRRTTPHLFGIQSLDDDVAVVAESDRAQQVLEHGPHQGAREDHRPPAQPQDLRQRVANGLQKEVAWLQKLLRYLHTEAAKLRREGRRRCQRQ